MQYGFVINHDACIGCHACTTACKAENDVPVGNFRTAVKYVEVGKFPYVRRHFLVQRCNHCTKAPCVTICPVNALTKRPDGIVDIDREACIGCRACMQACPYDALYLNEDLNAVEKCHFCAHRIDKGLAPACVNVCPVGAIVPGDLHDPNSPASRLKAENEAKARRTEQGTGPNVHYVGAHDLALEPGLVERPPTYIWSDRPPHKRDVWPDFLPLAKDARVVLDVGHKVEWGWPVSLYLVTKGIAAGCAMAAPFLAWNGDPKGAIWVWPEIAALFFTLVTLFLLVEDLKKPLHFYKLFTRPNWKSWLVKGGIILTLFSAVTALIVLLKLLGPHDPPYSIASDMHGGKFGPGSWIPLSRWLNFPLGIAAAGYTAFLFAQCKGRDLWEHRLLLPALIFQAVFCGGLVASLLVPARPREPLANAGLMGVLIVGHLGFWVLHHRITHGRQKTKNAIQAAAFAKDARWAGQKIELIAMRLAFAGLFACCLSLIVAGVPGLAWFGAAIALAGVFLIEQVYVRSAQLPPLS